MDSALANSAVVSGSSSNGIGLAAAAPSWNGLQ